MKPTASLITALVACSTLVAGSATAATISILPTTGGVTPAYQAPSEPLLGGNPTTDPTGSAQDVRSNRDPGLRFEIDSTGTIDKIALFVTNFVSSGTRNFTINFFKIDPATTSQADLTGRFGETTYEASVIDSTATITATDLSNLGVSDGDDFTLVVDVADTAVTAGEVYAAQIDILANGTDDILSLRYNGSYTEGFGIGANIVGDYHLAAYGVPEPGSLALMGLGGLLIARRRRG